MQINAVYRLLSDPPVYLSSGTKWWHTLPRSDRAGFVLAHPMWFFGPRSVAPYRKQARALAERNLRLILLHNSEIETIIGRLSGLPSHLLNQNMHTCEHWFSPRDDPIQFNAIYTAAAAPYKRIELALDVPKLFVLTYFWPDIRDETGKWRLGKFDSRLEGVRHNVDRVERQQVPRLISAARCGLALSRVEGAMWASMEYLMCGLPVVTTWNVGGRNFYLDDSNSVRVRATRASVKEGALAAPGRCAPRAEIRRRTLIQVEEQRQRFVELVARLTGRKDLGAIQHTWWAPPNGIHAHRLI